MNDAEGTAPSNTGGSGDLANALAGIVKIGTTLQETGKELADLPFLGKLAEPLQMAGSKVKEIAGKIESVSSGVTKGFETGGAVGGILGGASAILGEPGETPEGEEKSTLDKAREKVAALRDIWTKYYSDLRDEDGKLNTDKLKNLALEVGETILGSKRMAKVRKALAIASILQNNTEAISKAAAALPPPFNLPLIATARALGSKLVASISGQAHGGLSKVPSTGTYLLERGERVVGKRLNQDLSGFLAGATGDGGGISQTLDRSVTRSSTFNPTINMTIGDNARADAVFANRGALESMIREIYADYAQEAPFGA